ncbi:hypothetical protein niasHT_015876 [Heterodera trifolii]|uniref:Uncharacterized protein n=1 Tax=Heterodera trifolii TaxID=157864 RepID=A0ABD2LF70_9BILA
MYRRRTRNIQRKSIEQRMEQGAAGWVGAEIGPDQITETDSSNVLKTRIELTEDEEMAGDEAAFTAAVAPSPPRGRFTSRKKCREQRARNRFGTNMATTNTSENGKDIQSAAGGSTEKRRGTEQSRKSGDGANDTTHRLMEEPAKSGVKLGKRDKGKVGEEGSGHADIAENGESDVERKRTKKRRKRTENIQQNIMPNSTMLQPSFNAKHSGEGKNGTNGLSNEPERTARKVNEKELVKKVQHKIGECGTEGRRIRRRMTPPPPPPPPRGEGGGTERAEEREEEAGVTELHILEQGLYPPIPHNQQPHRKDGRIRWVGTLGEPSPPPPSNTRRVSSIARRYIHEKAIFDELTHLKNGCNCSTDSEAKMYSSGPLVQNLVPNVHSIHPALFPAVCTHFTTGKKIPIR